MLAARLSTADDHDGLAALRSVALTALEVQRDGAAFLAADVDKAAGTERFEVLDGDAGAQHRAVSIVGLVGEVICGYGILEHHGSRALLSELFVHPDCRGVGLGDAVLVFARSLAQEWGCTTIDSLALPGDRHTKNFFEAHAMKARLITVSGTLP